MTYMLCSCLIRELADIAVTEVERLGGMLVFHVSRVSQFVRILSTYIILYIIYYILYIIYYILYSIYYILYIIYYILYILHYITL